MSNQYTSNQAFHPSLNKEREAHYPIQLKSVDLPFGIAAFLSFVASVALWFTVDQLSGIFVGIWVPSILSLWCGIRSMLKDQPQG